MGRPDRVVPPLLLAAACVAACAERGVAPVAAPDTSAAPAPIAAPLPLAPDGPAPVAPPLASAAPSAEGATALAAPCRGRELDFDAIAAHCRATKDGSTAHPEALQLELEVPTGGITSGSTAPVWVHFKNGSAAALSFQLEWNKAFDVAILNKDGTRADQEGDFGIGGLGLSQPNVVVELEPGGVLRKRIPVTTRVHRLDEEKGEFVPGPKSIRPGTYTLDVSVPLRAPPGSDDSYVHVTTPLRIGAR